MYFDSNPIISYELTHEGFLRVVGTVAKTGWLVYQNKDGTTRKEFVPEDTLFNPEHLDSIGGKPLTLEHPPNGVNPQNFKQYSVGLSGTKVTGRKDSGLIDIVLVVCDDIAIQSIIDGKTTELSMGYHAETLPRRDGNFTQIKRICNHIALTKKGRAGPEVALHLDGWHQVDKEPIKQKPQWQILSVTV